MACVRAEWSRARGDRFSAKHSYLVPRGSLWLFPVPQTSEQELTRPREKFHAEDCNDVLSHLSLDYSKLFAYRKVRAYSKRSGSGRADGALSFHASLNRKPPP